MALVAPAVAATGVAVPNPTGQDANVTVTGGTVQSVVSVPQSPAQVVTPAVPASTVTATNSNPFYVVVTLTGFTATVVSVNGSSVGNPAAGIVVPPGGTVAVTYTVAGTWAWAAATAGLSGNPIASPSTIECPPGGSITLFYSAAPTWAWSDPLDTEGAPWPAAENTVAISEAAQLPYPAHTEGGQAGLGDAVSN
ncbi:MAG TPA: hypothetical protein VGI66_00950 [Streptosporangiaceae bacterium]|jgi:hypothetical protein